MAQSQPRKIFIAATMQDQGKTTVSLGLMAAFQNRCPPVCFIKPVGQRYIEIDGVRVDEDVALLNAIFPSGVALADMSPVTVGRTFTREYFANPQPGMLANRIRESFARASRGMGFVVIEGTGHAGVGSCFDTSNADVAALLDAKVILVTSGGIGKPIDEVLLNQSLFRDAGVELLGVVLNKVLPDKLTDIGDAVRSGLARKGIELLGVVPYNPLLANPTMQHIREELEAQVLQGGDALANIFNAVVVGAMAAPRAMNYLTPGCLLITPTDRDDLLMAVLSSSKARKMAGILLTGGNRPSQDVLDLVHQTRMPVLLVEADSYSAAAAVHNVKVKILPDDTGKIAAATHLINEYVNVDRIMERV
jgi:hypothetical protein